MTKDCDTLNLTKGSLNMGQNISKTIQLLELIKNEAANFPDLFQSKNSKHASVAKFVRHLKPIVDRSIGINICEQKICEQTNFAVDFFIRTEKTVIELELSLSRSHTNFERDIFKVLLANDNCPRIRTLILLGEPKCMKRLAEPGPKAIIDWVQRHHRITIEIQELQSTLS